DTIEFRQQLKAPRGWGYEYVKRLALPAGDELTIEHRLKNTGTKAIDTEQYCHNFVILDQQPVGPGYRLGFKFNPRAKRDLKDAAKVEKEEFLFSRGIDEGEAIFTELEGSHGKIE